MLKTLVNIVSKNKTYQLNISFQPLNLRTLLVLPIAKSSHFDSFKTGSSLPSLNRCKSTTRKIYINSNISLLKRFISTTESTHCESTLKKDRKTMDNKPNVVFVLGGPGAGKGTQCGLIVEKFGFIHLSAGDLLREERNNPGSEFGELIEKHIRDGTIVPVEITCSLIEKAMIKSGQKNFLIDGFPRNQNNLDGWNTQMADKVNILFVLFIDCPQDICVSRCLERGQAGSGRSDDNPESLKKRALTYMNDTVPIVNYFEEKQLVRKVNATKGPTEVFDEVKAHFANISSLL